jgi:hypothetical protein
MEQYVNTYKACIRPTTNSMSLLSALGMKEAARARSYALLDGLAGIVTRIRVRALADQVLAQGVAVAVCTTR